MKKHVTLLLLPLLAATLAAHAQLKIAVEGQTYTISSTSNASIANATSITIQWRGHTLLHGANLRGARHPCHGR